MEENGTYQAATSSEWGNWSGMLQGVTQYGLTHWIDSETREDSLNGMPYIVGNNGQVIPVVTSSSSGGMSAKLLLIGGLMVAAFLLLRKV